MSHELYIGPDGTFPLHPGDIQREHPNWEIGDDLPPDWRHVVNVAKPEDILIYPEFGEGKDETNTAPIKQTLFYRELSVEAGDDGMTYNTVWNPVTYDIVEEPPPHEIG